MANALAKPDAPKKNQRYLLFYVCMMCIILFQHRTMADINSLSGNLYFDVDSNGTNEMILTRIGLGLGIDQPSANLEVNGNAIISSCLGIGSLGSSNLYIGGTIGFGVKTISWAGTTSGNYTAGASAIYLLDSSSGNLKINLPYAGNVTGQSFTFKKQTTQNSIWIRGGGNQIDNLTILELKAGQLGAVKVFSDGKNWLQETAYGGAIEEIASANLVAWFKLDEGLTSTIDHSSSSLTVTEHGHTSGDFNLDGPVQRAVYFDGVNDYFGLSGNYIRPTTEYSITFWIKKSNITTQAEILSDFNYNAGPYYGYLIKIVNAYIMVLAGDGTGSDAVATTGSFLVANVWQHIIISWANGVAKVYCNGQAVTMTDSSTPARITYTNTISALGAAAIGTIRYHAGYLDDVRLYNRNLTTEEMNQIYELGRQ